MKSFLAACGIEDSFQFAIENQGTAASSVRLLYQPFAVIGRDLRADVVLDHADISRRHVYLQVVEGRVFWVDLESRTGTRSERESQRFGWLEGGRTFGVGPYVIRRFVGDRQTADKLDRGALPRDTPLVARAHTQAAQPEVALEFLNGPSRSMLKPVHRVLSLIGSATGCKFRLTDSSVSRFHGSLLQTSAGLWIVDLLGQKGITINDVPVRSSRLLDGDIIQIGRYQIRVRSHLHGQSSGTGFSDLGHTAFVPKSVGQNRVSSNLKSTNWASPAALLRPDRVNGHESPLPVPIQVLSIFPKADLMPLNAMLPVNVAQSELTGSMLVPLVNQFGLMQQQMFDQFQQAMTMMVQMFGTMHRDQMEVIRAELDQLRELTEEFHALKDELAERTRERAEIPLHEPQFNSPGVDQPAAMGPNVSATPPPVAPSSPRESPGVGYLGQTPASKIMGQWSSPEPDLLSTEPSSSPSVVPSVSEQVQKANSRPSAKLNGAIAAPDKDRDTVLWLHQRIMFLQRERETRWQKILKLVPGMSSS
jgi:pSer/pThr/pTyr-binding forkhead associated (FHA) protein